MLKKSFVFMMLLAASLVGISSIYQPANVETQPQPQLPANTKGLVTQKEFEKSSQVMADKLLLDRLFPQIIKRIDGNTLLQKFDGKLLAQKVFPYLDVNVILKQRPGQIAERKAGFLAAGGAAWGKAVCNPGETAVSAGFTHELRGDTDQSIFTVRRNDPNSNAWDITTGLDGSGRLLTYAECLTVELTLKEPQQPQQPPSPPPGGPPLQPPRP
jgi:hypothetical protein